MQLKIRELMEELGKRNIDVGEICAKIGLEPIVKAKSAFQRLYDDAQARIDRMDKLREKYAAQERPGLMRFISGHELEAAIETSTLEQEVREKKLQYGGGYSNLKPQEVRPSPQRLNVD